MARTNLANKHTEKTHEGAPAARINDVQALRRSVMSCLLWEREFYEDGESIADRVRTLALAVDPLIVSRFAIEARNTYKLRHAPLWLLCALAKTGSGTSILGDTIPEVVKRVDEIPELISMFWKASGRKKTLPAQMKKGLAAAFGNFKEYHFAKYDRDNAVKLRDALFLVHPKPADAEREALYKRIAARELVTPDTWEVALSGGADKKETFERLIREGGLGYLALLRNLRNMADAGCDLDLVRGAVIARKGAERVLPFRYVAAARACPQLEPAIDNALLTSIEQMPPLPGRTLVLVDVSGSMDAALSAKSDMKRIDAAAALAALVPGDVRMFTFSNALMEVAPRRGMAGVDGIINSQAHGGTRLFEAVRDIMAFAPVHDRLVVITDEQAHDSTVRAFPDPVAKGYLINVASNKNGVGYGKWTHIDGFSEAVLTFIRETEAL